MDKAATGRARYRYVSSSDKSWLTHHLGRDLERQIVSSFVGLKPTLAATIADGKSLQAAIRTKLLALDAVVCGVTEVDQVSALRRNQASVSNVSHCLQRTRTTTKVPRLMATGSWANLALAASAGQIPA